MTSDRPEFALAIHGGAGVITKDQLSENQEQAYRKALDQALDIGKEILAAGGTAIDAVVEVVVFLENDSLFNAGKGAVFNHEGLNEMDASIMDGSNLNAGAVAGVTSIKNPILAARAVLEQSEHVFLTGKGAEEFATKHGIDTVDAAYFRTDRRWKSLQRILDDDGNRVELDHHDQKHGTVGAVALDKRGHLAAATSTGGMTNKRYNRVGDSPIIGAGTYADDATCAVSSTGHGEYFIRHAVAYDISAQMKYAGKTLKEAGDHTINNTLLKAGGTGGIIALDKDGNIHMPFNTEGMYRGYVTSAGRQIRIFK